MKDKIKKLIEDFDKRKVFMMDSGKFSQYQKEIIEAMIKVINEKEKELFNEILRVLEKGR